MARVANDGNQEMADHDLLVRMDTKLDVLIVQGKDHEERLRVVEKTTIEQSGQIRDLIETTDDLEPVVAQLRDADNRLDRRTIIMATLMTMGGGGAGAILTSLMNGFFH